MAYDDAKINCRTKFGSSGGILFEPKTTGIISVIDNIAKTIDYGNSVWIGINDFTTNGAFVYTSNNEPVTIVIPWSPGFGNHQSDYGPVSMGSNYDPVRMGMAAFYDNWPVTKKKASVCEREMVK